MNQSAAEALLMVQGLPEADRRAVLEALLGEVALESSRLAREVEAAHREADAARRLLMAAPGETLQQAIVRALSSNAKVER